MLDGHDNAFEQLRIDVAFAAALDAGLEQRQFRLIGEDTRQSAPLSTRPDHARDDVVILSKPLHIKNRDGHEMNAGMRDACDSLGQCRVGTRRNDPGHSGSATARIRHSVRAIQNRCSRYDVGAQIRAKRSIGRRYTRTSVQAFELSPLTTTSCSAQELSSWRRHGAKKTRAYPNIFYRSWFRARYAARSNRRN